jgi:V/A-type H+-transporting ATPase subunit K
MEKSKKIKMVLLIPILMLFLTTSFFIVKKAYASETVQPAAANTAVIKKAVSSSWAKYIAAAISVGLACIGAGLAVASVGSSAIGAISEKPELFGRALTLVGLSEGIAIWGLIIAILILNG